MKRLFTLLVAAAMMMSMLVGSVTASASQDIPAAPEYINMDSDLPIVKEGYDVTLKIAVYHSSDFANIEDLHFWNLVREKMNINVEVEQIFNRDEYVQLAFASDVLPDIMIGMGLTPQMLMQYGARDGQLISVAKYINEEWMPNLQAIYDVYPDYKAGITAPDGEIYSLGSFMAADNPSVYPKRQINTVWLEEAGLEMPKTLDDFTNILAAFKARGDDIVPLGGSNESESPFHIILNAYGYLPQAPSGLNVELLPALRNGKVVIPVGDREVWAEVLGTLNMYYENGYINRDFYTMDQTAQRAVTAEGRVGVIAQDAFIMLPEPENFRQFITFEPLTSEYNDVQQIGHNNAYTTGGFVITNACTEVEAAIRFANYCLGDEGSNMSWVGAVRGSENLLEGWGGWYLDENYTRADVDRDENPEMWANAVEYLRKRVAGFNMGAINNAINEFTYRPIANGMEPRDMYEVWKANPENGDFWFRPSVVDNLFPYATASYPSILFFSAEENERLLELKSVIDAHAKAETARFVTGARPLSEVEAYFNELDNLGFQEYLAFYVTAYENYLANIQ